MERHLGLRKNIFRHIDCLRGKTSFCKALPVRASEDPECAMAADLRKIAGWSVKGFGPSDCRCESRLFGMEDDPVQLPVFIGMLYDYRIGRIERELTYADTSR